MTPNWELPDMAVRMEVLYEGNLQCTVKHGPSGQTFQTEAPVDNEGRGQFISPTDLAAASMGSCMMTIMGIYAKHHGIQLQGAKASVTKEMARDPRRIKRISVDFEMPAGLTNEERGALESAALSCPVHRSFHPDVEIPLQFFYPD